MNDITINQAQSAMSKAYYDWYLMRSGAIAADQSERVKKILEYRRLRSFLANNRHDINGRGNTVYSSMPADRGFFGGIVASWANINIQAMSFRNSLSLQRFKTDVSTKKQEKLWTGAYTCDLNLMEWRRFGTLGAWAAEWVLEESEPDSLHGASPPGSEGDSARTQLGDDRRGVMPPLNEGKVLFR